MKYKREGINKRHKLKHQQEHLGNMINIMKGEDVEKPKARKKRAKETKPREQPEKELEKHIIHTLTSMGYYIYKTSSSGGAFDFNTQWNKSGISDLIVLGKPHGTVFMEIKQSLVRNHKDGGLKAPQKKFRDLCANFGVKWCVVYSVKEAIEAVR